MNDYFMIILPQILIIVITPLGEDIMAEGPY